MTKTFPAPCGIFSPSQVLFSFSLLFPFLLYHQKTRRDRKMCAKLYFDSVLAGL